MSSSGCMETRGPKQDIQNLIRLPLSEGHIVYIIINNTSGLSISITNISN